MTTRTTSPGPLAASEVRRSLLVLAAIVIVAGVGIIVFWLVTTTPPGLSSRSQIAHIEISAYPEGPSPVVIAGSPQFQAMVEAVPVPLPRKRLDFSQCHFGVKVTIRLVSGASVTYGPCKLPLSIERVICAGNGMPPNCDKTKR